jgi:hypothetical protein
MQPTLIKLTGSQLNDVGMLLKLFITRLANGVAKHLRETIDSPLHHAHSMDGLCDAPALMIACLLANLANDL